MKNICTSILSAALVASLASPSAAQPQNKAQQACLNKVVKAARKIPGAVLKDASLCIKKGAAGKLPPPHTADSCLAADLKGKVLKSRNKLDATAAKSCTTEPDFGFLDAPTAADAYVYDNQALSRDAFGADLDLALAGSGGVDPSGRCSATLPGVLRKLEDSMHREVEGCLKSGLKGGTVVDVAGFEACLDSIHADVRGRVAKSVGLVEAKLLSSCPAGDLDTLFPGLPAICGVYGAGTDAAGVADCSRDRLECRVCRIFNAAWGLDRDCDLFDNPVALGSCPDCGNTAVDAGEECDDGNEVSGDGCSAQCLDEFCGDGVINDNGAEECDDGAGNGNTPDACRAGCVLPVCGDGVPDSGEECDDGNSDEEDGCTSQCTSCGNGTTGGLEQCDDGNNDAGDCCSPSCTFEAAGTSCTDAPDGECTDPRCNGAGACTEQPADEGTPCTVVDECANGAECQSGTCTTTSYVVTGQACNWAVVGNPYPGSGGVRRLTLTLGATSTGPWCGDFGQLGESTTMTGDLVTMRGDGVTPGSEIDNLANISAIDVVSNNAMVRGLGGDNLPGLVATTSIAPGNVVPKTPSGKYDTTGSDPRVAECAAAQLSISTSTATQLDALSANASLGTAMASISASTTYNLNPVNVGGLNVIDVNEVTGGSFVTINVNGGGDPDTVIILRVQNQLNTNPSWTWNLQNGMTANHFLIYGKHTTNSACLLGQNNVGAGTLYCPNGRITLTSGTQWTGSLFGGGTSSSAIDIGQNVILTHERFTGF